MKRGQLAAIIVIVLLVAAIGGFIVFSGEKAGYAVEFPSASQPQTGAYNPVVQPSASQFCVPQSTTCDNNILRECNSAGTAYADVLCAPPPIEPTTTAPQSTYVPSVQNVLPQSALVPPVQTVLIDVQVLQNLESYKPFFTAHNALTAPVGEKTYVFEQGTGKVLLTAPHAVDHIREGSVKESDYCTGPIVKVLKDLTGVPIMYLQYQSDDPNYYDSTEFKSALGEYLSSHPEIVLVLDIHGADLSRDFDVDLGDMNGGSLFELKTLPSQMEAIFKVHGIPTISHNFFSAAEQQTVTKYVAGRKINAMQVEINRRYRCTDPANDIVLLRSLEEIIKGANQ